MGIVTSSGIGIAENVTIARGLWGRFRGLMGKSPEDFPVGSALVIDPCSSIHMFFMRFPIDVLYVDRDDHIVRIQEDLRPWRIGPLYTRGTRYVVELPAGTVAATSVQVGDRLRITLPDHS